jgi:hypothetical protein
LEFDLHLSVCGMGRFAFLEMQVVLAFAQRSRRITRSAPASDMRSTDEGASLASKLAV